MATAHYSPLLPLEYLMLNSTTQALFNKLSIQDLLIITRTGGKKLANRKEKENTRWPSIDIHNLRTQHQNSVKLRERQDRKNVRNLHNHRSI